MDIDDPASRKVAAYWDGLLSDGLASRTPLWGEGENKERATGKVATIIGAAWSAGNFPVSYPDAKGKWAIAPLPTWDGKASTGMYGGTSYIVPKGSKQTKAAAEFIKWVTTDPEAMSSPPAPARQRGHARRGGEEVRRLVLRRPGRLRRGGRGRRHHRAGLDVGPRPAAGHLGASWPPAATTPRC